MKLSDLIKTKDVKAGGATFKLREDLTWSEYLANRDIENAEDRGIDLFERVIQDWDLTDDADVKLPVTRENISKLSSEVAAALLEELNTTFFARSKKKMS